MAKPTNQRTPSKYQVFLERPGTKLATGLLALLLAYAFASWAIDSGSLLDYAITVLLLFSGIRDLWDVIRTRRKQQVSHE